MKDDDLRAFGRRLWFPLTQLIGAGPFPPERSADERAVREVLTAYTFFYDSGDLGGLMAVFTDDAVLVNPRGTFSGREAIERNFAWLIAARRGGIHLVGNVVARPGEHDDTAWLAAYYQAMTPLTDGQVRIGAGTYFHMLRRYEGIWRIQEARITDSCAATLPPAISGSPTNQPVPTGRESSAGLPA